MSFDDAEKAIQEHLDVGRVLVADRGLSKLPTPADYKKIQPYTSGRLFVSKDGRQYMAIFDEPPAASRKVVAMWMRRHVSDQEMASRLWRGSLIKSLTDQYGSAGNASRGSATVLLLVNTDSEKDFRIPCREVQRTWGASPQTPEIFGGMASGVRWDML